MIKYYIWPDGTFISADEYNEIEFSFLGNDFTTMYSDLEEDSEAFNLQILTIIN